jgi:hypothetical protein
MALTQVHPETDLQPRRIFLPAETSRRGGVSGGQAPGISARGLVMFGLPRLDVLHRALHSWLDLNDWAFVFSRGSLDPRRCPVSRRRP